MADEPDQRQTERIRRGEDGVHERRADTVALHFTAHPDRRQPTDSCSTPADHRLIELRWPVARSAPRSCLAAMLTPADHRGSDTDMTHDPIVDHRHERELRNPRRIRPQRGDEADLRRLRPVTGGECAAMDVGDRVDIGRPLPSNQHAPECDRLLGMPTPTRAELAAMIDHTLLKPEATSADVAALVDEARELGAYSVCVSPSMLPVDAPGLVVAAVAGFPSGKHHSSTKAAEARLAAGLGAGEIDVVIDVGAAVAGNFAAVEADVAAVRAAVDDDVVLKVIIESAVLRDDAIVAACRAAEAAGADFVKTSTGFHPAGGASVHAVTLMAATVGGRLGVKASGGIRTADAALALVAAGATRLGLSATRAVLDGLS